MPPSPGPAAVPLLSSLSPPNFGVESHPEMLENPQIEERSTARANCLRMETDYGRGRSLRRAKLSKNAFLWFDVVARCSVSTYSVDDLHCLQAFFCRNFLSELCEYLGSALPRN